MVLTLPVVLVALLLLLRLLPLLLLLLLLPLLLLLCCCCRTLTIQIQFQTALSALCASQLTSMSPKKRKESRRQVLCRLKTKTATLHVLIRMC